MDRLSALDAEFLHMEDDNAHMHIAGVCVFADPPPPIEQFRAMVAAKLHLIPRYRQRVRTVPLELGRPVWVDDQHFRLDHHIRHTALPAPGDDRQLTRLVGRLMAQPLDRNRPLWEAWLVEGLAPDRWALVFKVHHAMVDGIAGVELLTVLLGIDPTVEIGEPAPWEPAPDPPGVALVLDAWGGLVGDLWGGARRLPGLVNDPRGAMRRALDTGEGVVDFLRNLTITPPSSIDGSIGPHRVWAHSSASLADVATIRAAFGGTINDVVLAAVSGGYRALLTSRGEDPDHAVVRSGVPVSMRGDAGRGAVDNRVSAVVYELPVQIADPVKRLEAVRSEMAVVKRSHMAQAGEALTSLGNIAPPMIVGPLTRLALHAERLVPQRVINTVTTNVPGPQFPLYCLGHEMLEYQPYVPISYGVRIGTAILSYNGRLFFGITGDDDTAGDVEVIAQATAEGIAELCARATPRRAKRTTARRRTR